MTRSREERDEEDNSVDADDLEPTPKAITGLTPPDLQPMSIEALEDYIADMEAEIARVREAIAGKQSHRQGAEGLFRR